MGEVRIPGPTHPAPMHPLPILHSLKLHSQSPSLAFTHSLSYPVALATPPCPQLSLNRYTLRQDICPSPLFSTLLDISRTHSFMAIPPHPPPEGFQHFLVIRPTTLSVQPVLLHYPTYLGCPPHPLSITEYFLRASMVIYTPHAPVEPYSPPISPSPAAPESPLTLPVPSPLHQPPPFHIVCPVN